MAEQEIRNQHLIDTAMTMNTFKEDYTYMYDNLMEVKQNERNELNVVKVKITHEYRSGKADPTKLSSKYEQKAAYKKRKMIMQRQKREQARSSAIL